jgi:hypothetical protein
VKEEGPLSVTNKEGTPFAVSHQYRSDAAEARRHLDAETARRVARLLRLIFLTDDPNEVLRAVAVVRDLLAEFGLDGFYLASAFERGAAGPLDHNDMIDFQIKVAMQAPDILSAKEVDFLGVIAHRTSSALCRRW